MTQRNYVLKKMFPILKIIKHAHWRKLENAIIRKKNLDQAFFNLIYKHFRLFPAHLSAFCVTSLPSDYIGKFVTCL